MIHNLNKVPSVPKSCKMVFCYIVAWIQPDNSCCQQSAWNDFILRQLKIKPKQICLANQGRFQLVNIYKGCYITWPVIIWTGRKSSYVLYIIFWKSTSVYSNILQDYICFRRITCSSYMNYKPAYNLYWPAEHRPGLHIFGDI